MNNNVYETDPNPNPPTPTPEPVPAPTPVNVPNPPPLPATPPAPPTAQLSANPSTISPSQIQLDILADVAALKGTLSNVAADARAEYEQLSEAARGAFHQLLNDVETKFGVVLAATHTLFGAR